MSRKDGIDIRRYTSVFGVVTATSEGVSIEFRERYNKRAVVTLQDWAVTSLVKQLAKLPQRRAEELKRIQTAFAEASVAAGEVPK